MERTKEMGRSRHGWLLAAALLLSWCLGCESKEKYDDCTPSSCTRCHGSADNYAPPGDTSGRTDPSLPTVGAHQAHLGPSDWHATMACSECHVVPACLNDPGHVDTPVPAELTWGALASTDGASPAYAGSTHSCSGVYCHGATLLPGGSVTSPVWNVVDGTQASCGSCHGLPPDPPHTTDTNCAGCHGDVIGSDGTFVNASLHINGVVNARDATSCSACHGSGENAAPPVDTSGASDTGLVTVGAHQQHLGASDWHREVQCAECHIVPEEVSSAGHMDGSPAELTWSGTALAGGAAPDFDRGTATCSGVYCHGATLMPGGTVTAPVWTLVDGTQSACGTCHSLPPGPPHPDEEECSDCHGDVVSETMAFVDPSLHINGEVNAGEAGACSLCHGSDDNAAPPVDTQGRSETTLMTVGAHQQHLGESDWHRPVACNECHLVPESIDDAGHIDASPAELNFSGVAMEHAATPAFDHLTGTCSGTYCHGAAFDSDGSLTEPLWTLVDGTQDACGTCHALPPPDPHPDNNVCQTCHFSVYDGSDFVDPLRHINGMVNF